MKKNSLLMIAVALILSSCGIASQYASSSGEARFQDGIYNSSPSFRSKAEKSESRSQTDALIEETKASRIYLFGEKKDTVMIPQNMSASIRYDKSIASTVVTVGENPYSWQYNVDPWYYYTPYSIGSSWYWSRHYDPWYWNRWSYSPWSYYGGWYDPYYYGGWYDPWYYGYAGWYGYMHPHYCDHHHHHFHGAPVHHKDVWHGSRYQTRSDKVFTSRVSTRGGTSSSRVSRAETGTSTTSRVASSSNASSSRSTATRVTATPVRTSAVRQEGASKRTVSDYRRPGTTTSGTTSVERSNTTRTYRASSSSSSSSNYRSSGSSNYRSSGSSSYRSSGSSSYRSSGSSSYRSSSSSSSSRSSSFSGGGSSRSGGSHGRR